MTELNSYTDLKKKIKRILLKQRLVLFITGIITTTSILLAGWIILSVLAGVMILPVWLKIALLGITAVVTVSLFVKFALTRLWSDDIEKVAVALEKKNCLLKGCLIAAIQFARMKQTPGYSSELMEQTEKQALLKAGKVNFNKVISFHATFKAAGNLGIATAVAILLLMLLPGLFSYSYEVYSNPTTVIAPPLGYRVVSSPESCEWIKYRDIEIGASVIGDKFPEKAYIYHRLAGGSWQKNEFDLNKAKRIALETGDSLYFSMTLRQINRSFDYYVEAGRIKSPVKEIDVIDRPRVNGIKLSIFYPDYTGLEPTVIDENNGSLSAVNGSRVNMQIETNLPVKLAELVFSDSSRTPMKITGKTTTTSLLIDESKAYYIRLLDHLNEENPDPIEYYITSIPDEYPSVDVVRPGFDVNLTDEMILPLKVRIFDDYGFTSLVLKYTIVSQGNTSEENVAVLHFSDKIKTEGEVTFNWDMDQFNLFPGDYVIYHFEIADNDNVTGPKLSKSRQFVARLPSLEEIIAETEAESEKRISRTEDFLKRGNDLMQRLKNATRKMASQKKTTNQADWQQQKELEAIAQKNQQLTEDIEKMAEKMDEAVDKMKENALLSREIIEKLMQIQKLYEEVATPEMKEAQRRLMEALKKMNRQEMMDAVKDMEISQEELLKRLERTIALLKKLQLEQKMEAMIRKIEQLANQQEAMNRKTDSTNEENLPGLSPDEEKLKKSLDDLKREAENLRPMMKEAQLEKSPEANNFIDAVRKSNADQDMAAMSQSMQQKQKNSASKQGKQAHSKLMDMLNSMQQQLQAMKGTQMDQIEKQMRMAIDDANYLSQNQEELLKKSAELTSRSVLHQKMAQSQQELIQSCNGLSERINELGKVSPFVAAEMSMLVNEAVMNMEMATECLGNRRNRKAQPPQRQAMTNLNRLSLRLMESLNQQKQCNKGGNCNSSMQKLESMCKSQNSLNQQTQNMCNNPGMSQNMGQDGQKIKDGLSQLAGEQAAIRKSMEQLAREFGNSRQILGRLDDIAQEMKKVEEGLEDGLVGPEVTERQLKIYSRMLEATRSLQRKDFSEQRKAKTAASDIFQLPPELGNDILNEQIDLEDRLRRYLDDSYPPQYEEQIKAYFKALLNLEIRQNKPTDDNFETQP